MSNATDTASAIIRAAVYDVALKGARTAALVEAPWLGAPVVSQIFNYLLSKFADWVYTALDNAVVFSIIDIETAAQRRAYDEAVAALKQALIPVEGGSNAAAISKAEIEFKKRLADLIRMRPA